MLRARDRRPVKRKAEERGAKRPTKKTPLKAPRLKTAFFTIEAGLDDTLERRLFYLVIATRVRLSQASMSGIVDKLSFW